VGSLELARLPASLRTLNDLARLGSASAIAGLIALAATVGGSAASAARPPRATDIRCLDGCAGRQKAAVGSKIRLTGRRLARVTEVDFPGPAGHLRAMPTAVGRHRVEVIVPRHARTGHPLPLDSSGEGTAAPHILRIVPANRVPAPGNFDLLAARVGPRKAFVAADRHVTLRYRFRARGAMDVKVTVVRRRSVANAWTERNKLPYSSHRLRWNGMLPGGHAAPRGHYRFKLKVRGRRGHATRGFRLVDGKFPVRGPHGYGGPIQRFGAPRSGGRVHQGQDVFAACGTRVAAAWGGRVQARGSDPRLYGNWVVIDGRGTRTDYRYAHFLHPASVHDGERVATGQRIGRVGKTGNAKTVGCMLHFEVWPHRWEHRRPVDPLPFLKRWDGWS
jgi:murein DD-endopeptidase MepM/ murein hydrolase activator NlpD